MGRQVMRNERMNEAIYNGLPIVFVSDGTTAEEINLDGLEGKRMIYKSAKLTFYDAKICVPLKAGQYLCFLDSYYASLEWDTELYGWNVYIDDDGNRKSELFPSAWAELPKLEEATE